MGDFEDVNSAGAVVRQVDLWSRQWRDFAIRQRAARSRPVRHFAAAEAEMGMPRLLMFYASVLKSRVIVRTYIGCTSDVNKRLAEYNRAERCQSG